MVNIAGVSGLILFPCGCATTGGSGGSGAGGAGSTFRICKPNVDAGLAVITCQPLNTSAQLGANASFSVQARGSKLSYTWYHKTSAHDFEPIDGATSATLNIANVNDSDYGIYLCAVGNEGPQGETEVQTRWATLGKKVGGAGGSLMPIQDPVVSGSSIQVCMKTVCGKKVRFDGTQTPPAGELSFRGGLVRINADGSRTAVNNSTYVLQLFAGSGDASCCSIVTGSTTDVSRNITAGSAYTITAFWIRNVDAPPLSTMIELQGAWLP